VLLHFHYSSFIVVIHLLTYHLFISFFISSYYIIFFSICQWRSFSLHIFTYPYYHHMPYFHLLFISYHFITFSLSYHIIFSYRLLSVARRYYSSYALSSLHFLSLRLHHYLSLSSTYHWHIITYLSLLLRPILLPSSSSSLSLYAFATLCDKVLDIIMPHYYLFIII